MFAFFFARSYSFDQPRMYVSNQLNVLFAYSVSETLKVTFANHAEGQWVLDWAQEAAEGALTPEMGGPIVSWCLC